MRVGGEGKLTNPLDGDKNVDVVNLFLTEETKFLSTRTVPNSLATETAHG